MIKTYATDVASKMGLKLTNVVITEGVSLGTLDAILLSICSGDKLVSEYIHQSDLDSLESGNTSDLLELKVRYALERLKILIAH